MKKSLCLLFFAAAAFTAFSEPITFKLNWIGDSIALGTGAVLTMSGLLIHPDPVPFNGKVMDTQRINAFDRLAVFQYSRPISITSDVTQYLSILAPVVLLAAPSEEWLTYGIMYLESALFAFGAKEILKATIQRPRPYMFRENPPANKIADGDYIKSFPSGHTTMAFNGAVFASYVFAERFPDSPFKIPVIAGSLALATATGVLRILGGNHYMTDVIAGAIIGSLSGFLVPWIHSIQPKSDHIDISVSPVKYSMTIHF